MRIHEVLGNVTLSRCHPAFRSARILATQPLEASVLGGEPTPVPDLVCVWDDLGAGVGSRIAVSDGGEAAQPFRPELKPVDAYCSAILDEIYVDKDVLKQLDLS